MRYAVHSLLNDGIGGFGADALVRLAGCFAFLALAACGAEGAAEAIADGEGQAVYRGMVAYDRPTGIRFAPSCDPTLQQYPSGPPFLASTHQTVDGWRARRQILAAMCSRSSILTAVCIMRSHMRTGVFGCATLYSAQTAAGWRLW